MNARIQKIKYKGTDIIKVDYRHCKEAELIALTIEHKELILKENKISFFLANYEHTFGTANYMKAAKDFTESTRHLERKEHFLALQAPKFFC